MQRRILFTLFVLICAYLLGVIYANMRPAVMNPSQLAPGAISGPISNTTNNTREKAKVEVIKKSPFANQLRLEGEDQVILRIAGSDFRKVRGYNPYYVEVPGTAMIYFVTEASGYKAVAHFYNLETRTHVAIQTEASELGYEIGGSGERREVVEGISSNTATVVRYHGDRKTVYTFDLGTRKMQGMAILSLTDTTNGPISKTYTNNEH